MKIFEVDVVEPIYIEDDSNHKVRVSIDTEEEVLIIDDNFWNICFTREGTESLLNYASDWVASKRPKVPGVTSDTDHALGEHSDIPP